jgi:hypothetical protein
MRTLNKHWTETSTQDFLYRIGLDFVAALESALGDKTHAEFAKMLEKSEGRVSQLFNNPGNLTLKTAVEYARALGLKVALVTYNDGDPHNNNGPVNPEIFSKCWERLDKPTDFFELKEACRFQVHSDPTDKPVLFPDYKHRASTEFGWQRCIHGLRFTEPVQAAS